MNLKEILSRYPEQKLVAFSYAQARVDILFLWELLVDAVGDMSGLQNNCVKCKFWETKPCRFPCNDCTPITNKFIWKGLE